MGVYSVVTCCEDPQPLTGWLAMLLVSGDWPVVLLFPVQLAIAVCIGISDTTRRNTIKVEPDRKSVV